MRRSRSLVGLAGVGAAALILAGCTAHPPGEREERGAALAAGKPYEKRVEDRLTPALPDHPTPDQLVTYALATNPEVEQRYWEWRSALEQVPIDGTQPTNLAIFGSMGITNGHTSQGQTTISAGTDPMADIVLPNKLDAAARRSLETARAAGVRFHKAQLDVRAKVLSAYDDYTLTAQLVRLGRENTILLQTVVTVTEARNRVGGAGQQDVLKAANAVDLSRNDVANMESQLPALRAAVNALLGRPPEAPLEARPQLPPTRPIATADAEVLAAAARQNPELAALADEVHAREVGIRVARLMYVPDLSLSGGIDLSGVTQTLSGMLTVPLLKNEAIHAAVAQAEANLRAAQAAHRQAANDLAAQLVMDLATIRDADRQLDLFERTILPRAREVTSLARTSYESGNASLLDLLDAQRSLIDIERLVTNLRATRHKRLVEAEALVGSGRALGSVSAS